MQKSSLLAALFLIVLNSCSNNWQQSEHAHANNTFETKYDSFYLSYFEAGMGSNMGKLCPTFKLKGRDYDYTFEQNSYIGERTLEPEFMATGLIRPQSIDSIIEILSTIDDTLIYRTNIGVSSGSVHGLYIRYGDKEITFRLHNAGDSTAQKIIDILNSNLPNDIQKLWLWQFPESF